METMLSALNITENLKIKELAVSAIGAIGKRLTFKLQRDSQSQHNSFYNFEDQFASLYVHLALGLVFQMWRDVQEIDFTF